MKILAISGRVPAIDKNGDQVISYFRLIHLARTNTVELICFGDNENPEDVEAARVLEASGIVVHFVPWKRSVAVVQLLKALPDRHMPFQCAYFRSAHFRRVLSAAYARFAPDALYSVMIRILPNAVDYSGRLFVEMVDSMGLNFNRRASMAKAPLSWLLRLEARRVADFERKIAGRADRCFVVSAIDQQAIGSDHVGVLPLGIDVSRFNKRDKIGTDPLIAFTGNMFYQPNVDAVLWFVENCWPSIKASIPDVRLVIVGSRPQPSVVDLSRLDKSIEVLGRVPSVAAILKTAAIAVAPMRSGSGMQFKILEAMACGVPVVATSIGQGDIGCIAGSEILIGDSPAEFAEAVVTLLKSSGMREAIGDAGFRYVQANHSWDAINQQFANACSLA